MKKSIIKLIITLLLMSILFTIVLPMITKGLTFSDGIHLFIDMFLDNFFGGLISFLMMTGLYLLICWAGCAICGLILYIADTLIRWLVKDFDDKLDDELDSLSETRAAHAFIIGMGVSVFSPVLFLLIKIIF